MKRSILFALFAAMLCILPSCAAQDTPETSPLSLRYQTTETVLTLGMTQAEVEAALSAEGIGPGIEKVLRPEDGDDGRCTVESGADGGVVDDRGLLFRHEGSRQTRAVEASRIEFAEGLVERPVLAGHEAGALPASGAADADGGCLSMKEGSPLVTKSRALRAGFEGFTPAESQTALSLSAQSVMNSASA